VAPPDFDRMFRRCAIRRPRPTGLPGHHRPLPADDGCWVAGWVACQGGCLDL